MLMTFGLYSLGIVIWMPLDGLRDVERVAARRSECGG
jgi:hypothetical protein